MLRQGTEENMLQGIKDLHPTVIAPVKGRGTRLYPLTLEKSKSLISVVNVSILERLFGGMALYGCKDFWIVGEFELYNYFRNGDVLSGTLGLISPVAFNYTTEDDEGNADGVKIALEKRHVNTKEYKIDGDVIVVSGDCVISIDWKRLMDVHRDTGADMTVVLECVEDVSNYGVAKIESDRIVDFVEKPEPGKEPSNLVNTFINVASADTLREVFKDMKNRNLEATDFGSHVLPYMTKNRTVRPYVNEGYWDDVGTPKTLLRANLAVLQGKLGGINPEQSIHPTSRFSIGQNVSLHNVAIGANVTIGNNCRLQNACIDSNATIEDDTVIEDSVVYFGANIGKGCRIVRSIIDRFGDTGEETRVGDYSPDETTVIGSNTKLGNSWHIWPGELVVKYSPAAREKIVGAKRHGTNLYKIIGDDGENLYFVDRKVIRETYNDVPPSIFTKPTSTIS